MLGRLECSAGSAAQVAVSDRFVIELEVRAQPQSSGETAWNDTVGIMKSIPRLIAGTALLLAAAFTAAPVTAGIADLVLQPGTQPTKRTAPLALTSVRTAPPQAPANGRTDGHTDRTDPTAAGRTDRTVDGRTDRTADWPISDAGATWSFGPSSVRSSDRPTAEAAGLVAHTVDDARSRVSDLAADLQSGVANGEFSQADADRVLADVSGYIRGERTWPERA